MAATFKFDRERSYFPLSGKLSDEFNRNFKMVIIAEVTEPQTLDVALAVRWKGRAYALGVETIRFPEAGSYEIVATWTEKPPTIAELLKAFGEEPPEKTTEYPYTWLAGWLEDSRMTVTDEWDTSLLVEIPPFPWEIVLPVAGLAIAGIGLAYVATRK